MLTIYEKLMLLALNDEKGTVVLSASTALPYGLAGAAVFDLFVRNRVDFDNKRLLVKNPEPVGDPVLDDLLEQLAASKKIRKIDNWVERLGSRIGSRKKMVLEGLIKKGILRKESHKILWIFNGDRYPAEDMRPENEVRSRIRAVVLDDQKPAFDDLALISLIRACDLISDIFDKPDRKAARAKIKHLTANEQIGKAVSETVQGIIAAVSAATSASAITVVGASS